MDLAQQGKAALESLAERIGDYSKLLTNEFAVKPTEVKAGYLKSYDLGEEVKVENGSLFGLIDKVQDMTEDTMNALDNIKLMIQLLVPKIQDGGNSGVMVQMQFIGRIGKAIEEVAKIREKIASFYEKRLSIIEKLVVKKDEPLVFKKEKADTLVSVDVKMFLELKDSVRIQRDFLAFLKDFMDKNEKKITDPRNIMDELPGFIM